MTKGKLIVITGPSGVGKGTLVRKLLNRHRELTLSISMTTRNPRPGEVEGQDYYFVTREQFAEMIEARSLLEWAEYTGNCYGTPRQQVEEKLAQGRDIILEIELLGARQIKSSFPNTRSIFILPPNFSELERRLRNRGNDSETTINKRLERAQIEIQAASEFDNQIVNDDLEQTLQLVEAALFGDFSLKSQNPD